MKNIIFFSLVFFLVGLQSINTFACSCLAASPTTEMNAADAVVIGKISKELKFGEKWKIESSRILKGKATKSITLYAAMLGTSCEISNFKVNETYVFFLNKIDNDDLATDDNDKVIESEKEKIGHFEPIVCSWASLLRDWETDEYKKILSEYEDKEFIRVLRQDTKTKGRKTKN